jgi:uncharacterized membrane protein
MGGFMQASILRIHRFLASQSLYPLILSSFLALGLLGVRTIFAHGWSYENMPWNLFLAWVPYGFSFLALFLHQLARGHWWMLLFPAGLWLIFFPNAPYLVTDFLHLEHRPPIPLWYDIVMLASFAWTGCFLAIASLRTMQYLVKSYLGVLASWVFVAGALALSGLGIYLGRFGRWNSWDLFTQPYDVVYDILARLANPLNNLRFFVFSLMFTAFLLVCYLMFASVSRLEELDHGTPREVERETIQKRIDKRR